MDFFKRLSFVTFFKKDVIEEDFLDAQTDTILNAFDREYRFKDVNELTYPDREIKTNLLYSATVLWTRVVNASHSIYKKIQILEADYIEVKSELDNKIEYELADYEKKRLAVQEEIEVVDKELQEYNEQRKEIEKAYHKIGEKKTQKGSLNRLNGFWFLFIMGIAGLAELFMYKNVFLSQEIGLMADKATQDKYIVDLMALGMASGFTVMIIWLAHKLGELLRHFDSATKSEVKSYIIKFVFISCVVVAAIVATVIIRGDMHKILSQDNKVEQLQGEIEDSKDAFSQPQEEEDNGFGSDDEEDSDDEDAGFGSDEEDTKSVVSPVASKKAEIEELRNEVNDEKGKTSLLFVIINIFIVVGGMFLSYETHTSSKIYETIERHLKMLEKHKKSLEEELLRLERELMAFKHNKINRLFKELLLKAALYDKEVRTYNTYMQIFALKMQLVEDYIKKVYEEKGIEYAPVSYTEIIKGKINLDDREELYHVKNIDEYMIYNKERRSEANV